VSMKHVCVAVLVALCLGALGNAALAADGWTLWDQDLPATIEWDTTAASWVEMVNSGTTAWGSGSAFGLVEVEGVTGSAFPIQRWGLTAVPRTTGTTGVGEHCRFDFDPIGPPVTSLVYQLPWTPTAAAVVDYFDCNWILAHPYTPTPVLIITDTAEQDTVVSRFPDDQPGTAGAWARFWIEELAGRVPLIVSGYPDGTYRPAVQVDRASMAVYMARALDLPTAAYEGLFPSDVPGTQWAWPWIEALARAGIVAGFGGGYYQPALIVNRDAMAVYVARGIWGGMDVPSGPGSATFVDVPISYWAYDEIEYCVANDVVRGYDPTHYIPGNPVTRDQMAVFVYKGFVMPTGSAVVLGGPAITAVDLSTADYWGWSSAASGAAANPGYAYVLLDAARPSAPLEITFELRGPATPTPTATVTLDADDLQAAIDAITSSGGVPYLEISWDIPAGLATGNYRLVVIINEAEVSRQPAFTIS